MRLRVSQHIHDTALPTHVPLYAVLRGAEMHKIFVLFCLLLLFLWLAMLYSCLATRAEQEVQYTLYCS